MVTSRLERLDDEIRRASSGLDEKYLRVLERAAAACAGDPAAAECLDDLGLHSELADVYDRLGEVEQALAHADVLVERGYRCRPEPRCRRADILIRHGRVAEAAAIYDIEVAIRTCDPERRLSQLRGLRAITLTALGRVTAEEYAYLDERWPDLADADADAVLDADGRRVSHPEYCRRLERSMREARDAGIARIRVAPLRSAEFARCITEPAQVIAWPPERNAACWRGSGRKYKKCCGGPGVDGYR